MNTHKEDLRRRREWLVLQAAAQRSELSYLASRLEKSAWWVNLGFTVGRALRTHPVLAVAGASLLLRSARNNRLLWVGQLFTAWELFNLVRRQWPRARAEKDG